MDKICSMCKGKFVRGFNIFGMHHQDRKDFRGEWHLGKNFENIYICEKCMSTLSALVRSNRSISTNDIMSE